MDVATFHPVFLFLGLLQAVLSVEPPTNVSLQCHNLHNVLTWSYDQDVTGVRFRVNIGSSEDLNGHPTELWVDPPAPLQVDVSFLSDPSNDYFLQVTAKIGENESEPAPTEGIIFSYFQDSQAYQKCFVDFPSVNVTAEEDGHVLLRFTHPWLLYHPKWNSSPSSTKQRKKKSHDAQNSRQLPVFDFKVENTINKKVRHHQGQCDERVCEEKVLMDAAEKKHCLKMVDGEVEKISVRATREYCVQPLPLATTPSYLIPGIVGGLLVLSAVSLVLYMIYRKQTTPSTNTPASMNFANKLKQRFFLGNNEERVNVPELDLPSPTLLLPPEEEEEMSLVTTPSTEPELRLRIGVPAEDGGGSDDVEEGNGNGEVPGYVAGRDLEDSDQLEGEELCSGEAPSGYEKRQVFSVEIAPDETAEGYRGGGT